MLEDFVLFVAVGFAAQLVDGAIGMAYGLSGTTVMLSFGIPPATASASVHAAEVFTTGISGFSHWRFGNVDSALCGGWRCRAWWAAPSAPTCSRRSRVKRSRHS